MTAVRYTRQFKYGAKGSDVEGVGRALARAKIPGFSWAAWIVTPRRIRQKWGIRKQKALKTFKRKHGLKADYIYTKQAHAKLTPFFDAKAKKLMKDWHAPLTEADKHWNAMMGAMRAVTAKAPGYRYGGEHDSSIYDDVPTDWFDCSSSSSYVLHKGNMFPFSHAIVSGDFRNWGVPGRGERFTVYYRNDHVWIRLYKGIWWRFDTSAYGDKKSPRSGPRLRFLPRPTWGFTPRHWPGM